jgi:hypothetical protein
MVQKVLCEGLYQKGMDRPGLRMGYNLFGEARIEFQGVTGSAMFFIGNGLHVGPLCIHLMTGATCELCRAVGTELVWLKVQGVVELQWGHVLGVGI